MKKYTIGIDYGTLSARALLVDTADGREIRSEVFEYPHGVIEGEYRGVRLGADYALQDADDYIAALEYLCPRMTDGIEPESIVGIGVDFTSSTVLPLDREGRPLSEDSRFELEPCFEPEPHAAVKLWKHHGAAAQAKRLEELLKREAPERLAPYGGLISSEWLLPKVMETLDNAPEVYAAADRFTEAGDYICRLLTGEDKRSICGAGYKAMYSPEKGYVPTELLARLDPRLSDLDSKLRGELIPAGAVHGYVSADAARRFSLPEGCPVASAYIDAHAAIPGCGVTESGTLLMIIGTSTGHLILSDSGEPIGGICGVVRDGVIPGKYVYEAGQSAVGDIFDWFVKNHVPESYSAEARERGISIHKLLREKAKGLAPGENRLLALDWWNGCRSPYQDASLSGLIVGLTLATKPEEVYLALLEATAYGTREIIDGFESSGVSIERLIAAGGIAAKDELMMQIYSDVTGREIRVARSTQAPALGSAIAAAVASKIYADFESACGKMGGIGERVYTPISENVEIYEKLYRLRRELSDRFGGDDFMKRLRSIAD